MPRKGKIKKRPVVLDSRYRDEVVAKFIATMMLEGKKSKSVRIFYNALDSVAEKAQVEKPLEVFYKALENVKPVVEVKSRRVGGATYQVPVEIRDLRRQALAMRWLIDAARSRNGKSMSEKLYHELLDASKGAGAAFKKKEETHRMAEANKAFTHYRW